MADPSDLLHRAAFEPVILPTDPSDPHIALLNMNDPCRNTLLADTSCWDTFVFSNRPLLDPGQQLLADFHALVGRSGSNPLSLTIVTDSAPQPLASSSDIRVRDRVYGSGTVGVVNDILLPYINRVSHLHCIVSCAQNAAFLLDIPLVGFGAVEIVDPSFHDNVGRPYFSCAQGLDPFVPFTDGPVFRTILTPAVDILLCSFQWERITLVDLGSTPILPGNAFRLMQGIRHSVVDLSLEVVFSIASLRLGVQLLQRKPIIMDKLATLRLHLRNPSFYPKFIASIFADKLTKVWFIHSEDNSFFQWNIPFYNWWFSAAANSLETLILMGHVSGEDPTYLDRHRSTSRRQTSSDLEALIIALPRLKCLRLPFNICVHEVLLTKIFDILPSLQGFELTTNACLTIVFDLIEKRNVPSQDPSPSLWKPAPILFAYIRSTLPTSRHATAVLTQRAEALNLPFGCTLEFLALLEN
ncbi:hypothetical protein CVT26_003349 [Gymnopilus dilepis]|uniref:F-box domain-containing protein n=1 Tax=Gymnopilus dilepis TaxID=231916 RepID=A0A409VQM6_9AGAR|nr:hypothetical protein CVT26_003349 [Gymnopilus dilepis]